MCVKKAKDLNAFLHVFKLKSGLDPKQTQIIKERLILLIFFDPVLIGLG